MPPDEFSTEIQITHAVGSQSLILYEEGNFRVKDGEEVGTWDVDQEANLILEFAGEAPRRQVFSICDVFSTSRDRQLCIGVLVVATGRYRSFLHQLLPSIKEHFLSGHDVRIYVFSDKPLPPGSDCNWISIPAGSPQEYQYSQYQIIREHQQRFEGHDFLFVLDPATKLVAPIGEEVLGEGITAVRHPYGDSVVTEISPEQSYFTCILQGGKAGDFLAANDDMVANLVPSAEGKQHVEWADEIHWNNYLGKHPPAKVLSPSYCYPEFSQLDLPPKILIIDQGQPARGAPCRAMSSRPNKKIYYQEGRISMSPAFISNQVGLTNMITHTVWIQGETAAPEAVKANFNAWRDAGHELRVWDWESARAEFPEMPEIPTNASFATFADVIRLYAVNKYGGLYVDADTKPLRPLGPLIDAVGDFVCCEAHVGRLTNCIFYFSKPNHPFLQRMIDSLLSVEDWLAPPVMITGPEKWTNVFWGDYKGSFGMEVTILSPRIGMGRAWWESANASNQSTYVLHEAAGSWL